jgi:hypothetical protein
MNFYIKEKLPPHVGQFEHLPLPLNLNYEPARPGGRVGGLLSNVG